MRDVIELTALVAALSLVIWGLLRVFWRTGTMTYFYAALAVILMKVEALKARDKAARDSTKDATKDPFARP